MAGAAGLEGDRKPAFSCGETHADQSQSTRSILEFESTKASRMKRKMETVSVCFNRFKRRQVCHPNKRRQESAGRNLTRHDSKMASRPGTWASNSGCDKNDSSTLTTVAAIASSGSSSTMIPAYSTGG